METVLFSLKEHTLLYVRRPKPKITGPKDVLIKIFFSGISRKDLYIIDGILPCDTEQPTLGHEICGVVSEVGANVKLFKRGDKVVVDPNSGCGICDSCRMGSPHCRLAHSTNSIGSYDSGGWTQYILVPDNQVYKIPESVRLEKAVLTGQLACVCHGLDLLSPISIGQRILIVGAGLLGNLWAAVLHFQGHRNITVSEPNLARLEYIQKLDNDFNYTTPQLLSTRHREHPDYLFDLIIDCSNSSDALQLDFKLLDVSAKLCIFGLKSPDIKISVSPYEVYKKELRVFGANINSFNFSKALVLLENLAEKYLDLESLGIKTYTLKEYEDAIYHVRKKRVVKAVFSNPVSCPCSY